MNNLIDKQRCIILVAVTIFMLHPINFKKDVRD